MRRRSWARTRNTYSTWKRIVGTVKKSMRRIQLAIPLDGVVVVSHSATPRDPNMPIFLGTWQAMSDSEAALSGAFGLLGIKPQTQGDPNLRLNELILYFGPEIDK
jgi:hypothetical protein